MSDLLTFGYCVFFFGIGAAIFGAIAVVYALLRSNSKKESDKL